MNTFIGVSVAALAALGYGLVAGRALKTTSNLAGTGVMGVAVLTMLFTVEHFFVPLRAWGNLLTLLPGVLSFLLLCRGRLWADSPAVAVMVLWACRISVTGRLPYDTGLYHLQSMLWNTIDSAIPGLANLHTRLGFNSGLFIAGSGLNIRPLGGWSLSFLAGALLEGLIAADLLLSIRSTKRRVAIYSLVVVVCLLIRPRWLLDPGYVSPDPVIAMGVLYALLLFLDGRAQALLVWVPFLCTVKLTAWPLFLLRDFRRALRIHPRAAIAGMLLFSLWLGRNVVLSGYLVFPVEATKAPVSWAVPKPETQRTAAWITSWARERGHAPEETRGLKWLRPWVGQVIHDNRLRDLALVTAGSFLVVLWKRALGRLEWRVLGVLALALVYWFVAAPDVRFGIGFVFAIGFLVLTCAIDEFPALSISNQGTLAVTLLAVGFCVSAAAQRGPAWPEIDRPEVRLASTPAGDQVWTPVEGDQCWATVPCSPEPQLIRYLPRRVLADK